MPFVKIPSAYNTGLQSHIAHVEVDVSPGLHSFSIIGLADKSIGEAKDRVSASLKNSGFVSPRQKNHNVIVSLTPSHTKKEGTSFDLAIALGYLVATRQVSLQADTSLIIGELTLSGDVKRIPGVLPMVLHARQQGFKSVILPYENLEEAALVPNMELIGISSLKDICDGLKNGIPFHTRLRAPDIIEFQDSDEIAPEMADIQGNDTAKRAAQVAISGRHNIVFYGPPGSGKTTLVEAMLGILPKLSNEEALEVTSIYSIAGELSNQNIVKAPFRSPHHTTTRISCIGGGSHPKPGEITLAHLGILFLDELPEFKPDVLNSLRQPMESRSISILRGGMQATFPANFMLVAAMNPCPCGNFGSKINECTCNIPSIKRHLQKIPAPFADRIDMWVCIDASGPQQSTFLNTPNRSTTSRNMRERVIETRQFQYARHKSRFRKECLNAELSSKEIRTVFDSGEDVRQILDEATKNLNLSNRSLFRIMKIARTIADMEKSEKIKKEHLLEALQYRPRLLLQASVL